MNTCSFEDCWRAPVNRVTGLCQAHQAQLEKGVILRPRKGQVFPACKVDGCVALSKQIGFCIIHYGQHAVGKTPGGPGAPYCCSVPECGRPVKAVRKVLCESHNKYGAQARIRGSRIKCVVPHCERWAHGELCPRHMNRCRKFSITTEELISLLG